MATLEKGSVKIFHSDVPYSDYRRDPKQENTRARKLGIAEEPKGYTSGREATSAVLTSCANNDYDDALDLTLHILRNAEPYLAPFGVILLWQAGTRPLRVEIQNVIAANNLEVAFELSLDKCKDDESSEAGNPGNFSEPYSIASEKLIVINRKGEELLRCDHGLPRGDIIRPSFQQKAVELYTKEFKRPFYSWSNGKPVSGRTPSRQAHSEYLSGRHPMADAHSMQKHEETSLLLLMKHCNPGDLVVDLCGCSASFCIAAEQYGCDWRYCEMPVELDEHGNQTPLSGNFDFGVARLAEYFKWKSQLDGESA
jgi:hypothetical protein